MKRVSKQKENLENLLEGLLSLYTKEIEPKKKNQIEELIMLAYTILQHVEEKNEPLASELFHIFMRELTKGGIKELAEFIYEVINGNV